VIKYLDRIESALRAFGPAELRRMAAATMRQALLPLGPVRNGALQAGTAFGTEVTIDYWLVGPAQQPILRPLPSRHQPAIVHALAVVTARDNYERTANASRCTISPTLSL